MSNLGAPVRTSIPIPERTSAVRVSAMMVPRWTRTSIIPATPVRRMSKALPSSILCRKRGVKFVGHFKFVTRLLFQFWTDLRKHGDNRTLRPDSNFGCLGTNGGRKCEDDGNCCDPELCHGPPTTA